MDSKTFTKSSASRVRKHRQRLRDTGSIRLEISLGADVAADIKALAASRQVPRWVIVQDALVAYVSGSKS